MIEKARELGVALAHSPEFLRRADARRKGEADAPLNEVVVAFREKRDAMVKMIGADALDNAVALELSNDLERLQQQLFENPLFSELVASEQSFSDLLNAVNQEINACIGIDSAAHSCGGDCGHCNGCAH